MPLSSAQKYGIGAATLAAFYLWRKDEGLGSVPTFTKDGKRYFGSSPSLIGINAQPGAAGFHPAGATFSIWTQTTEGPAATSGNPIGVIFRIAPTGDDADRRQEWVRVRSSGNPYSGIPYSGEYDPSLPILRLSGKSEAEILSAVLSAVYAMIGARTGIAPDAEPLVLTSGAPGLEVPPEIAIAEFDFEGEDPRP